MTTEQLERLLRELAASAKVNDEIFEAEVDAILATAPDVTLSANFRERALEAMAEAQKRRQANNEE